MHKLTTFVLGAVAGIAIAGVAVAKGKKEAVLLGTADLKWMEAVIPPGMKMPEGAKPPMVVNLWGDMGKNAHGAMVKLENGPTGPLHTHSAELKGVIVQGTFVITPEGGEARKLGPGSYFMVPSGWKHTSGCEGGPCILFQEGTGKFDLKPVAEAGMKK